MPFLDIYLCFRDYKRHKACVRNLKILKEAIARIAVFGALWNAVLWQILTHISKEPGSSNFRDELEVQTICIIY
jgi:hypothetical protein